MLKTMNLEGTWRFQLDEQKRGLRLPFEDTIDLPNTTSHAKKGRKNEEVKLGALTDEYAFEGKAWFAKEVEIPVELDGRTCFLYLERTRVTTVWVDGQEIGTRNSLSTPHIYDVTAHLGGGKHTITICVDNTDYPTKGGHLTSEDTQTNWNGITGRLELQFFGSAYLTETRVYPHAEDRSITIKSRLVGEGGGAALAVSAQSFNGAASHTVPEQVFPVDAQEMSVRFILGEEALLWSEERPNLYTLDLCLKGRDGGILDRQEIVVGLREFKAAGEKFTINGRPTFLRGKHDGLIFPKTGFAPTEVEEWVRIMSISKAYGINHYRFHTCCPPEAAFTAADLLGIYMEPELPFWGTITDETYDNHNQAEQDYLIREGYAMLQAYGNHPSFVMMSLGNELWGSKTRINAILKEFKAFDNRPLYTQGSNNFQFVPEILEEEDFFCGVRFSRERLIRGSYAMCDAPLGHVQTDLPGTLKDYDEQIVPPVISGNGEPEPLREGIETIQIQYGTETKTVEADAADRPLVPHIPVVSHEIGQYATFPNFEEIEKYTGSLKARNFEVFRERLEAKGLGHLAKKYFECSGKLAVACYKEELEAAFRTQKLAGFQLLDLQDFSGQGTALVGVLDAFMDSKGLVSPEEWRSFCSDAVLLARFEKYNYEAGEDFMARIELSYYREAPLAGAKLQWRLQSGDRQMAAGEAEVIRQGDDNYVSICEIHLSMPEVSAMTKLELSLSIGGTDMFKTYDLWVYPKDNAPDLSGIHLYRELSDEAIALLERGESVLLLPHPERLARSIEGVYSTDFWCYPMFRSISESMNKPVPVGTMGLLIDKDHPVLRDFPSEEYSTYPWWNVVSHSSSVIMDELPRELMPLVQTIDNFERNHKLGLLFECRVRQGRLLMGALDYDKILESPEGRQFMTSLVNYVKSGEFAPRNELQLEELQRLFRQEV